MNAASEALIPEIMDFTKCYHHICHDKMCKTGDKKCLSDCMWSRCSGFGMKCNVAQKSGPKTCETAFTCFESCKGPTTIQCLASCYTTLSKPAQSDYTKLWFCLAKSDAPQPFSDCLATALDCASGGTTGTKSCLDVSTCDSACKPDNDGEKFSCTAKCYGGGTSAAQGQFNALMKCVLEAQTAGADPGKLCGKSVAVCAGSKPDGTKGTLGCQEISGCEQVCKKANGEDAGCTMTCLGKSTVSEAMKWWELAMCWGKCSEKCKGGSATCVQDCVSKDCKAQSLACLGG
ncbi:MAG: hypothetical protein KC502_20455 [Myxococcales bacterium]|nr:hypothetical protein [Myxococcales bacterium]